jgi:hypothetical protein
LQPSVRHIITDLVLARMAVNITSSLGIIKIAMVKLQSTGFLKLNLSNKQGST